MTRLQVTFPPDHISDQLRATAYHESGHAVVCTVLELGFTEVSIDPNDPSNGWFSQPSVYDYHYSSGMEARQIARKLIMVAYAGMPAERLINRNAPERHGEDDYGYVLQLCHQFGLRPRCCCNMGDENYQRYLNRYRGYARRHVRQHSRAIRAVAEVLLTRNRIQGNEIDAILAPYLVDGM